MTFFKKVITAAAATTMMAGVAFAESHAMSKDIVDTAAENPDFSTLVAAVQAADLVDTLKGEGPFTVFAPTNAAFEAVGSTVEELLKPENKDKLTTVLTYHVVPGKVMSTDLAAGDVATVEGSNVTVNLDNGVMINDATVTMADIDTSNGVIHVIDKVLIPEGAM